MVESKLLNQQVIDFGAPKQRESRIAEFITAKTPLDKIQAVVTHYPEMAWLTGRINTTPEQHSQAGPGKTIGEILFNAPKNDLIEFNRTAVGILTLDWILKGDYEAFTACQKPKDKLSKESFDQLQKYTRKILPDEEAVDAMVTYIVINDLGKISSVVDNLEQKLGLQEVDHDKVLLAGLETHPEISPSYQSLSSRYKELIKNGLRAKFSIAQFIQGENTPANLNGLSGLDQESLDFYLLHAVTDMAGAAGQFVQNGSAVMTEPTYQGFRSSIESLEGIAKGHSPVQVYDNYLESRAKKINLDIQNPTQRAATRLSCMLRISESEKAREVQDALTSLPENTRAILEKELNKTGVDDGYATLLYYSPALLLNIRTALEKTGDPNAAQKSLEIGLTTLARIYQEARITLKKRQGNGVFTVMVDKIAKQAGVDPVSLTNKRIQLASVGEDAAASLEEEPVIDTSKFHQLGSLSQIPGQRIAAIGMGGGSDAIQAAMISKLLENENKKASCVISIRTEKTGSQGVAGAIGEKRTIQNHGGEIAPGIFRVKEESSGSGRFLENIPAGEIPTFLIIDNGDEKLTGKIQAVLDHVGGVDTVIGVDTGGDALYSTTGQDNSKATPDQDLNSLRAINSLKDVNKLSFEIAVGVDTPPNGEEILSRANASFYPLKPNESDIVLAKYSQWRTDGSDPGRYGKTPLAWQAALRGKRGYQCLPLPKEVVLDDKNPWNTFVHISSATAGIFIMSTESHLNALSKK